MREGVQEGGFGPSVGFGELRASRPVVETEYSEGRRKPRCKLEIAGRQKAFFSQRRSTGSFEGDTGGNERAAARQEGWSLKLAENREMETSGRKAERLSGSGREGQRGSSLREVNSLPAGGKAGSKCPGNQCRSAGNQSRRKSVREAGIAKKTGRRQREEKRRREGSQVGEPHLKRKSLKRGRVPERGKVPSRNGTRSDGEKARKMEAGRAAQPGTIFRQKTWQTAGRRGGERRAERWGRKPQLGVKPEETRKGGNRGELRVEARPARSAETRWPRRGNTTAPSRGWQRTSNGRRHAAVGQSSRSRPRVVGECPHCRRTTTTESWEDPESREDSES